MSESGEPLAPEHAMGPEEYAVLFTARSIAYTTPDGTTIEWVSRTFSYIFDVDTSNC